MESRCRYPRNPTEGDGREPVFSPGSLSRGAKETGDRLQTFDLGGAKEQKVGMFEDSGWLFSGCQRGWRVGGHFPCSPALFVSKNIL
ncbi:MAG: hypothetical protein VST70_07930 [Nitrospirota bacterium]|nr:hypothetical protein [Nitrospirota bacterium]